MNIFKKFKSKLFEILHKKIKSEQDVEKVLDALEQRFADKVNTLREVVENNNDILSDKALEQYLISTIYGDKDVFLSSTTIDLERLFVYLIENERIGGVKYSGESLYEDTTNVVNFINESRTKCRESKKIAKEDVQKLIASLEKSSGFVEGLVLCNALPFEDQSIFNDFLRDLGAVTDGLKTMCAKCSEENITGEQFKTFEAIFLTFYR